METRFFIEILDVLKSDKQLNDKYDALLDFVNKILYQMMLHRKEIFNKYSSISTLDRSILEFYMSWRKYPGLGIPDEKYLNIIEKILDYVKMIIETKCEDYKTLPGMTEFLAESDRQYEEIVTNDPELQALRNDPYGL